MISVLKRVHPRLAALLGASPATRPQPRSTPAALDEVGTIWPNSPEAQRAVLAAEQEAQRVLQQFFEVAPERLSEVRSLFARISATSDRDARQVILGQLCSHVRVLRSICDSPQLEPVCKVTEALERLVKQISEQPASVTPSTLRTMGSSIILLETLSKPGLKPDLASNPPPRFLNIDDDPFCRRAVSSSLRQAFSAPDDAENGEAALALIEKHSYDMIFLDVEMPGINGFEVCTKIHSTQLNRHTPVVFVTFHHDFDSRAKASDSGGNDLIAKPFLPSELTLKALTVLLRRRMQSPPPAK